MCGINGYYQFTGSIAKNVIASMNDVIAHRGPDASGDYSERNIQLGHRRLSILDLSKDSNQPFVSPDKRYVLVFNGEIYNYKEIREELTSFYAFKTSGDTEVVLAAFMKYGPLCLRQFNGMFSFAIWDNERKELFAARDRYGIKPFYYSLTNDFLLFSSSMEAILKTDLVKKDIDNEGLVDYLRYQTVHAPKTIVKSIKVLLPGEYLISNEENTVSKKYYKIAQEAETFKGNREDAKIVVKEEFSKAVKRRVISDVPFGAFLSGGIDSSLIVANMAMSQSQPVKTFSVSFLEDEFSEAKYAKLISDKYSIDHTQIDLSVSDFKELIPAALEKMDHPSADGLNTYVVSQKTRQAGIKMALSGLGGDEVFGGYSVFNQVPELRSKKWLQSFPAYARKPMANIYKKIKGTVEAAKISELLKLERFDTEHVYSFYRTLLLDDQIRRLINTSEQLPVNRVFEISNNLIGYGTDGWKLPDLSKISVAEISTYMSNVLLRDTDNMTMAHGLEVRVPFLDHELVNKVLGINDQIKNPVTPKKLLVDAFKNQLPKEVYDRKKMGFVLPYAIWMKEDLRDVCEEGLTAFSNLSFINKKEVDLLWNKFLKESKEVTWSRIWALVTLGYWLKRNNVS